MAAGRLPDWAGKIALAAVSLAAFAAACELLARAARPGAGRVRLTYMMPDPLLGHRHRPGARATIVGPEYAMTIAINSRGLRGAERDYAPASEVLRVLLLGDSFVEGLGVNDGQTVADFAEKELEAAGQAAEVINAGIADYSTDQEYLLYREEGRRYGARVVAVFVHFNDLGANLSAKGGRKPLLIRPEGGRLEVVPPTASRRRVDDGAPRAAGLASLRWIERRLRDTSPRTHRLLAASGLWPPVDPNERERFSVYSRRRAPPVEAAWARLRAILRALGSETARDGARLLLVYVPDRIELDRHAWAIVQAKYALDASYAPDVVATRLGALADGLGLPLLDLRDALRGSPDAYFERDMHWTATGHRLAGERLARFLREGGWPSAARGAP
ncbi:MAG: SGNH/GDSL hydrolase family protein [Acidobacteria bacterium]|nr:SGNH/GDSL hydrolase family protein [Acidobacteriota bacterium]